MSKGKGCLIAVGVIVALMVVGALVGDDKPGNETSTENAAAPAVEVVEIKVTPKELQAAYEANEAAAQQKYGKSALLVNGTISAIQLDFSDKPFLVLVGTNEFMGPQAHLDKDSQAKASSLTKGQNVSLSCDGVSEVVGTPMLQDCRLN